MNKYEKFTPTIEVSDKYCLNNVVVSKDVSYRGDFDKIKSNESNLKVNCHSRPLAAAVLGSDNTSIPIPDNMEFLNAWTEADAQEIYLKSKPPSYIIIGKPGSGTHSVGEALSKKLNCPHICPKNVLIDEIDQKSPTGNCIQYNLRNAKACKINNILPIMKSKLESPAVKHRGFILSGIPFFSSDRHMQTYFDKLFEEESLIIVEELLFDLIFNLKRKKPKGSRHTSITSSTNIGMEEQDEAEEEDEEEHAVEGEEEEIERVELSKFLLEPCSNIIRAKKSWFGVKRCVILQQIDEMFNVKPDTVIQVSCPDIDAITKRSRKYFNYMTNANSFNPFMCYTDSEVQWPKKYTVSDYVKQFDVHSFNPKYSCKHPINFSTNAKNQLCNYKDHVKAYIDKKLKFIDPKFIIKVDGRTSTHQMMYLINERFVLLRIKPVLLPEPLYLEEPPEDDEDFWNLIGESNVIRSENVSFNRYPSAWYNRCPVELKNRRSTHGKPKFAVTFLNHVYVLSSLIAMGNFCRNPRPYLKLEYLEPTCRIAVMGSKLSGKTMISRCLAWIFNANFICFDIFYNNEKQKKYNTYAKTIFSEIIPTIEDNRFIKWKNLEYQRTTELNAWLTTVHDNLKKYVQLSEYIKAQEEENNKVAAQDKKKIKFLVENLKFLPFLQDLDFCKTLHEQNLVEFAPIDLNIETPKPEMPILGDEDVMNAISAYIISNDLQKEILPTPEEIMNEFNFMLEEMDKLSLNDTSKPSYCKFVIDGFPCDEEYWDYLITAGLLPDYIIALIENREIDEPIILNYINIKNATKNYEDRFFHSEDILFKTKLIGDVILKSSYMDIKIIIDEITNKVLDEISNNKVDITTDNTEFISSLTESIEKFGENWQNIKSKIDEYSKSIIEVELEEKSDIEVLDEVLLKLRRSYCTICSVEEDLLEDIENDSAVNVLTFNFPRNLCETNIYCPIAFYKHNVLWEGKSEFCVKYNNKIHYFSNEQCLEIFQRDCTRYQALNKPFKKIPPLRICVIGCIGSGRTTLSKQIAKELGLLHIDYEEFINYTLVPKHYKKVGWKYENSFTDSSLDEENAAEIQIDEDESQYLADILSNEVELRRLLYSYFEGGSSLPSIIVQKLMKILWHQKPYSTTGVVIDGFPKIPSDVDEMISGYCIPDIVIDLQGSSDETLERLSRKVYFKLWKDQLKEAKQKVRGKVDIERYKWLNIITKKIVIKVIIDEVLQMVCGSDPIESMTAQSTILDSHPAGLDHIDPNLFSAYNEIIEEYPEPIDTTEWEKPEDARERINSRLEGIYEAQEENIESLKEILEEHKIKIISINGLKVMDKVLRIAFRKLSNLNNRNESFFEQTVVINSDIAEMLILEGFYFLSKFGRMCPVYIFDNETNLFNPYNISKRKGQIFPVIHRAYIYFISSEKNLKCFRNNPLKYINSKKIVSYIEFPLRIGIIGPPKSGKSLLASKLAKRYGLLCLSKGFAVRYIMENFRWTELGTKITSLLQSGQCISNEYIIKSVKTVAIDYRVLSHGFILDGFPETPFEASELLKEGLYPLIMLNINTNLQYALAHLQNEVYLDILKYKPPYPQSLVELRYSKWTKNYYNIDNWIMDDIQNIYHLCGDVSKWQCLNDACSIIGDISQKVFYYLSNCDLKFVPAGVMCISKDDFTKKLSAFKNFCPICYLNNVFKQSEYPVDRNGIVQYMDRYYWVCATHIRKLEELPNIVLPSKNICFPEMPAVVKSVNPSLVYENGICIVSYAENLPSQRLFKGSNNFAALHKGNYYLFCSSKCLEKFLCKPHIYYDIKVFKEAQGFPKLPLKSLPHLGYLEQTVGNIITQACCAVNVSRPKYLGLDVTVSGLIYIALYLKVHNPACVDEIKRKQYIHAFKVYEARCKLAIDIGLRLRSTNNPFAKYPLCCGDNLRMKAIDSGTVGKLSSVVSASSTLNISELTSRVPVPDERYDFLCEYHKPASKVPAFLNVVDIAGLVRGAAEGQGLGNAFLSHIKACDAIFNLCRAFDDEDVIHVDGDVNPIRDLETIGEELRLKDEEQLIQNVEKLDRVDALMKIKTVLVDEKKHLRFGDWSAAEVTKIEGMDRQK
ncbi:unnamed protein product [Leptidea sinapis]|uniref:OBG-type G domain-containing protein n=1 Tax=Leptidea sinapis TaxID=189913 RepID=A0A5E4QX05_9NEOP|nr:unnamed protein product [Leptidea sinapis]